MALGAVGIAANVAWAQLEPGSGGDAYPLSFVKEERLRENNALVVRQADGDVTVSADQARAMYTRDFGEDAGEVKDVALGEVSYATGERVCRCWVIAAHPAAITVDAPAALTPQQREARRKHLDEIFSKPTLYRVVGIDAETGEYRALAEGF